MDSTADRDQYFTQALGTAVLHVWADLPPEVQERLFEHAVVAGHSPSAMRAFASSWPSTFTTTTSAREPRRRDDGPRAAPACLGPAGRKTFRRIHGRCAADL